ncbi:hypothetical protein HYDPIDRAFT_166854 [Hydnomerulius pinastri MD-312]|nr:hypothetical protein HYDPIDRAFT_166854 [Hydnomerulius pinastri MD-312]
MAYHTHTSSFSYPTPPLGQSQRARKAPARTDTIPTSIEFVAKKKLKHVQLCQSHGLLLAQAFGLSRETIGERLQRWLGDQPRSVQIAFDHRYLQLRDSMDGEPSPPPTIKFKKPATEGHRLTHQELEQFKDLRSVYGKIFKADELFFKVVSIAELPGGPEIKLWYEIVEDLVEVAPDELWNKLSRTDYLYYPEN